MGRSSLSSVVTALLLAAVTRAGGELASIQPLGQGTAGASGIPALEWASSFAVEQPVPALRLVGGAPGAAAQLVLGAPGIGEPLPAFGATLYPGAPRVRLTARLDGSGSSPPWFAQPASLPVSLSGLTLDLQGVVVDATAQGGLAFTAGLRVHVGLGSGAARLFDRPQLLAAPLSAEYAVVAAGDLDGNGRPDVLVAWSGGALSLGQALDDGVFVPLPAPHDALIDARDGGLLDQDGDGAVDLLLCGVGGVELRPGSGDGLFGPSQLAASGEELGRCDVGDLDGDGLPDVVAARTFEGDVLRLHGVSTGGLAGGDVLPCGLVFTDDVAVGDVDADGDLDVVALDGRVPVGQGLLAVLRNDGAGAFAAPLFTQPSSQHANTRVVSLGDLDGDGAADLLLGSLGGGAGVFVPAKVETRLALGDGGFGPGAVATVIAVHDLHVVDLDGDGASDVLVDGAPGARWLAGLGAGALAEPQVLPVGQALDRVLADTDGDTLPDLLSADRGGLVSLLVDATDPSPPEAVDLHGRAYALTDLDADGDLDLVGSLQGSGDANLKVALGDGAGGFASSFDVPTSGSVWWLQAGDVTADGLPDVVTLEGQFFQDVFLHVGLGDGDFAPGVPLSVSGTSSFSFFRLLDLDDDGDLDLLGYDVFAFGVAALMNDGAGSFTSGPTTALQTNSIDTVFAAGDLDGDGLPDLVVTRDDEASVDVRRGLGDGGFGPAASLVTPFAARLVHLADLDGDGLLDLLLTGACESAPFEPLPGRLALHLGHGDLAFAAPSADLSTPACATWIETADLDADGAVDVVLAADGGVTVLLGFGDGGLAAAQPFGAPSGVALTGDLDHDGDVDLVASSQFDVVVLRNRRVE